MNKLTHEENVFAYDLTRTPRHISEVKSGKRGYHCMGCGQEMIAKKGQIRTHHFSHDPKDISHQGKCTFSDETYRHKLAKETLQRIKRMKVPAVYKFPPIGVDGQANKLREAKTIHAHDVKVELQFYENEQGDVCSGRNHDYAEGSGKYLLIQPDVTFFDSTGQPMLFVELVATHKIDTAKLSKLKRLGIDTVQVIVPKASPQDIEQTFSNTGRTEWIYNHERETTTYVPLSSGNSSGISPLTEFQRKLLKIEESYSCRASELNNLIRAINKALGGEQYQRIAGRLGAEINRVEENTRANQDAWESLQRDIEDAVGTEFADQERELDQRRAAISERRRQFRTYKEDLGRRYRSKGAELDGAEDEYRASCADEISRIESRITEYGADPFRLRTGIADIQTKRNRATTEYQREVNSIESRIVKAERTIDEAERRRASLQDKYRGIEERLRAEFEERRAGLAETIEEEVRASLSAIENEDPRSAGAVSRRLRELLDARQLLGDIPQKQRRLRRLQEAKRLFDAKAYEDWV